MFTMPKRHALVKRDAFYYFWRYATNSIRTLRAIRHVPAFADTPQISRELEEQGIVSADSSAFLTAEGQQRLAEVSGHLLDKSRSREVSEILESGCVKAGFSDNSSKNYLINLLSKRDVHLPDSTLLKLALDAKLLEIVAGYLGLWPRLDAVNAWLNFPTDSPAVKSQIWHRDPEDLKIIKVFIYLVDVDKDRGPFTFIPKTHPFGANAGKVPAHEDSERIQADEMNRVFPPESHLVCTGPANTMILADTVGYHRGGKPHSGNRILLTFTYTSAWPRKRHIKVSGKPSWQMNDMQRMAL